MQDMIEDIQANFDDIASEAYTSLHDVIKCQGIDKETRNAVMVNLLRVEKTASSASRNLRNILDKLDKKAELEKAKADKILIE